MSASKAAEMIVAHTQAASYHQGMEAAYTKTMLLVRQVRQRLDQQGAISAAAYEELARMEEIVYDLAKEEGAKKDKRNKATREAAEALVAADNAIR